MLGQMDNNVTAFKTEREPEAIAPEKGPERMQAKQYSLGG